MTVRRFSTRFFAKQGTWLVSLLHVLPKKNVHYQVHFDIVDLVQPVLTDLITESDKAVRAVQSCKSWLANQSNNKNLHRLRMRNTIFLKLHPNSMC